MKRMKNKLIKIKEASVTLSSLTSLDRANVLIKVSDALVVRVGEIIEANKLDVRCIDSNDPLYDRLLLTYERIKEISDSVKAIAEMEDVIGEVIEGKVLDNGLKLSKIRVPLGVVGVLYESRPNVTVDVFALCFKSGNACVLKGGSEALNSNLKLVEILQDVLCANNINEHCLGYIHIERDRVKELLQANEYIDVLIPRGSKGLIEFVRINSTIPVIETGAGVVHTYFSKFGDLKIGKDIIHNAKTRRPSVCNSLDTLIINSTRLNDLYELVSKLEEHEVIIYADQPSYNSLLGIYRHDLLKTAKEDHFGREYLSLQMSIKTVDTINEALNHIRTYSSKHSEAIISNDSKEKELFTSHVDAAVVYVNTSTSFTDGGVFGMGAEIGISTQKLHARGPMGLYELTSYKWVIRGCGQIRGWYSYKS